MAAELFIGLMSGTSIDGIDAALVRFESENRLGLVDSLFLEFDDETRQKISHTAQNNSSLEQNSDSPLHAELAPLYANAVEQLIIKSGVSKKDIAGIANHGQTVKHEPNATPPYSLQLGDAQIIANITGITTYSQFRQADLAVGGQGAPLMPAFHKAVFDTNKTQSSFIVNIGGISNITHLGSPTIGFDTGPGNVLLDQWIERHKSRTYDENGIWALSGTANQSLLRTLLSDRYFSKPHPKSTGTDYFNLTWLDLQLERHESIPPENVQATLAELTAQSIAADILECVSNKAAISVFVCGGGAHNRMLMASIERALNEAPSLASARVYKTNELGIPSDWVEAVGFAWLGYCRAHSIVSNMPSVTAAKKAVVLGEVYTPNQ